MNSKSKRQQQRRFRCIQKLQSALLWAGMGILALLGIGFLVVRQASQPAAMGKAIPLMTASHIPLDSDPGVYNSDPPTSGPHYAEEAQAGFYDENIYTYPAGYLVHNLEHGYVVFWYNCNLLDEAGCANLKSQIKAVMDELGSEKMIAYPWPSLDVPLVMTSWERLQKFEIFYAEQAKAFYRGNLNRAPEPNAP